MLLRASTFAAIASSMALTLVACSQPRQDDPRTQTALVRAATATSGGQAEGLFSGIVGARVESDLGFRVPGKIVERLVDAGQTVKAGQPLMKIDSTDLALANAAQSDLVAAAQARAIQTAADEKRLAALVSAGAVSASAYDLARAASDAAKAMLASAQAQANVIRNQAGYAVLVADVSGVVMETRGEPGQVVAAGQTVVRLAKDGPREAIVDLPETVRPAIGSTGHASIFGDARADGEITLRQLSKAANPLSRTFEAHYVLQGPAADAPIGSTVTVRLPLASNTRAIEIPLGALHDSGKGPGVWVIDSGSHVTWRAVGVSSIDAESASITKGLQPGERFVALGAHLLHEGQLVRMTTVLEASK